MDEENHEKTEEYLKSFSFKPTPPALKGKILDNSLQRQKKNNGRTDHLLKGLAGCSVLLILAIAIDTTITRSQNKHFSSILQKHQESKDITEEERFLIKDIVGEFLSSTKIESTIKLYDFPKKKKKERRQAEWRKSLEKEIE
jgi:hypothetical protein